jgi:hypothetical protein
MERGKDVHRDALTRDQAANYRIRVQGRIGRRWSDWFDGLSITQTLDPVGHTILTGRVTDQSALLGTLGKLVTLNFPLLLVEHIPDTVPTEPHLDE